MLNAYVEMAVRLCYQANVNLAGFWSQLKASCMPSHTDESNTTVSVDNYIYIYIYIIWNK